MDNSYGFILYSFFIGFAIPLSLITVFYYLVVCKLKTLGPKKKSKEKKRSHRKVTNLVLTIITCYIFFWLPYWVMQIFLITTPAEHCKTKMEIVIFVLVGCLAYSNSSINPLLYAFLSDNFKKSFLKACSCSANNEYNFKLQTDNSLFLGRLSRNRNSEKRSSIMVKRNNFIEDAKDTAECISPFNGRKVLQTDL